MDKEEKIIAIFDLNGTLTNFSEVPIFPDK